MKQENRAQTVLPYLTLHNLCHIEQWLEVFTQLGKWQVAECESQGVPLLLREARVQEEVLWAPLTHILHYLKPVVSVEKPPASLRNKETKDYAVEKKVEGNNKILECRGD